MDAERPKKTARGSTKLREIRQRLREINDRLADLVEEMAEYEGEALVRATKTEGEWEQWRIAHPPRDEDEPGHRDDMLLTGGTCNVFDLMADLATYVVAWNGEPLPTGGFEALNLLRGDKKEIAAVVVGLYESAVDLGKWRSALSARLKIERSSN